MRKINYEPAICVLVFTQFFAHFFAFSSLSTKKHILKNSTPMFGGHSITLELMSNLGVMTYFVYFAVTTVVVSLTTAVQILYL